MIASDEQLRMLVGEEIKQIPPTYADTHVWETKDGIRIYLKNEKHFYLRYADADRNTGIWASKEELRYALRVIRSADN